jgi:hypothetical protein
MLRRIALLTVVVTVLGLTAVVRGAPANAAGITSSNIASPVTGAHYLITDVQPATTVVVSGTTSGGTGGDLVDIRCYTSSGRWETANEVTGVPIGADGSFSAQMSTYVPYGTCVLRAVPHDYPGGAASLATFTGPKVTTEYAISRKILSGPHAGMVYDYYVEYQSRYAMNDVQSATDNGLEDTRLLHPDGTSSNVLWNGGAALRFNEAGARSHVQVDGRNAFGPYSAAVVYPGSQAIPGLPALAFSVARNATTGTITIHETDPLVVCPSQTFPPTAGSCPQFRSAGLRLERTIVIDDGGRQVHLSDVWRSTDGKGHSLSAHYDQGLEGFDYSPGSATPTLVGAKLPWISTTYQTFSGVTLSPGPARVPASLFVRDDMAAADGNVNFPRGALVFDRAPSKVERSTYRQFNFRYEGITVPAGGTRLMRQAYVTGTSQAAVDAKARAIAARINPWRPDTLIRKKGASVYAGNGVYDTTATHQTVGTRARRGARATFYVKVQNDGTQTDSFRLKGSGGSRRFAVHYFAGSTDVTSSVVKGTYLVKNLVPGATRAIGLVIKVRRGARIGTLRSWLVAATSTHDATRKDVVRARVRVRSS